MLDLVTEASRRQIFSPAFITVSSFIFLLSEDHRLFLRRETRQHTASKYFQNVKNVFVLYFNLRKLTTKSFKKQPFFLFFFKKGHFFLIIFCNYLFFNWTSSISLNNFSLFFTSSLKESRHFYTSLCKHIFITRE